MSKAQGKFDFSVHHPFKKKNQQQQKNTKYFFLTFLYLVFICQNGTYRDLYGTALERIQSLEHDQDVLQSLFNSIQSMRVGMVRHFS